MIPLPQLGVLGRRMVGAALLGWGIQNFIYHDFVLGRAPAWPAGLPGREPFAWLTGAWFILTGVLVFRGGRIRSFALVGAGLVLVWAVIRHLLVFLPHPNLGVELTQMGKSFVLVGGLLAVATPPGESRTDAGTRTIERTLFLWTARIFLGVFLFNCGLQHFLYGPYVAPLVPHWIPGPLFWTYFAGVMLVLGGIGLLLPPTVRPAAVCSGLMIFLWFLMLHLPRTVADPHSESDWLALFESLGFSGIAWVIAASVPRMAPSVAPAAAITTAPAAADDATG